MLNIQNVNIASFLTSVIIASFTGVIGSIFIENNVDVWYTALEKPLYTPPAWIFSFAWTLMYFLMGTAAYIMWRHRANTYAFKGLVLYICHLFLITLWTYLFFGAHHVNWAMYEILFLLYIVIRITMYFFRAYKPAGWIFVPYVLWITFATYLNIMIAILN